MELEEIREKILELQSVAGKILVSKNLGSDERPLRSELTPPA
jgi:hypothetical protein